MRKTSSLLAYLPGGSYMLKVNYRKLEQGVSSVSIVNFEQVNADWAKCSKNEAGLKIFAPLCDEKMCPFQKQTYSGSGIVFYYFFKFQRLLL